MKSIKICILLLFAMPVLHAQAVLTSSLNFAVGDYYRMDGYIDVPSADPGPSGANIIWDFGVISGGTFITGSPAECVNPVSSPFADSAAVASSNICVRPGNSPYEGPYQYYRNSATSRKLLAVGYYETGNNSFGTYYDDLTALEFPLTYGNEFSNEYEYLSYHIDFGYYFMRDSAYSQTVADGWGSITTPAGNYANVLRLKTTIVSHSWYRYGFGQPWIYMGAFTDVQYDWYSPALKVPLMVIRELGLKKGDAFYNIDYLADYNFTTGTEEYSNDPISIYPNPAGDNISISYKKGNTIDQIKIYDQQGRLIFDKRDLERTTDISGLAPGMYVMQIQSDKSIFRKKIIKK